MFYFLSLYPPCRCQTTSIFLPSELLKHIFHLFLTSNTIVLHQNVIRNKREGIATYISKVSEEISLVTDLIHDALSHSKQIFLDLQDKPPTRPETRSRAHGAHRLTCRLFSLCQVEKRLELVKQVSHSTHKKLTACLQGQQGVDVDKKSVRSPSVRNATFDCDKQSHSSISVTSN